MFIELLQDKKLSPKIFDSLNPFYCCAHFYIGLALTWFDIYIEEKMGWHMAAPLTKKVYLMAIGNGERIMSLAEHYQSLQTQS